MTLVRTDACYMAMVWHDDILANKQLQHCQEVSIDNVIQQQAIPAVSGAYEYVAIMWVCTMYVGHGTLMGK